MANALTRELTRFLEVRPATGTKAKALHTLIVGTSTLGLLSLLLGIPLAMTGTSGVFLAISAYDRSLRSRARVLSRLALAYLVVVAIGAAASALPVWLSVIVLAVLGTAITLVYHTFLSDPPGPLLLILGAAAATYIPTLGVPIPLFILVTGLALLIGCSVSLLLHAPHSRAAVTHQLEQLRTAVEALDTDLTGTTLEEVGRLRDAAFGALFAATAALRSSSSVRPGRFSAEHLRIEDEIHDLHLRLLRRIVADDLPWAEASEDAMLDHYVGAPRGRYLVRWAFSLASPAWLAARRTGLALLLAGEVSVALGLSHPFWAVMTAGIVLSVTADRVSTTRRAGHRVVGTILGVGFFLGLNALHPPLWATAAIVVACISVTQMLAPRQYLLASIVITPIPLLMAAMHATAPIQTLILSRIVETGIGAVAAMLVLWLPGRRDSILLVRREFRRALVALDIVLRQMAINPSRDASIRLRRNLHFEQLAAARILAMVLTDQPEALEDWPKVEAALNELTYTVLTAARTTDPVHALDWLTMARELEAFLATLPPVSSVPVNAAAVAVALTDVRLAGRPDRHPSPSPAPNAAPPEPTRPEPTPPEPTPPGPATESDKCS